MRSCGCSLAAKALVGTSVSAMNSVCERESGLSTSLTNASFITLLSRLPEKVPCQKCDVQTPFRETMTIEIQPNNPSTPEEKGLSPKASYRDVAYCFLSSSKSASRGPPAPAPKTCPESKMLEMNLSIVSSLDGAGSVRSTTLGFDNTGSS